VLKSIRFVVLVPLVIKALAFHASVRGDHEAIAVYGALKLHDHTIGVWLDQHVPGAVGRLKRAASTMVARIRRLKK